MRVVLVLLVVALGCSAAGTEPGGSGGSESASGGAGTGGEAEASGGALAGGSEPGSGGAEESGGASSGGTLAASGGASGGEQGSGSDCPGYENLGPMDSCTTEWCKPGGGETTLSSAWPCSDANGDRGDWCTGPQDYCCCLEDH
jgi:hypothetical protein